MYPLPLNYDVARHFQKLEEIEEFFRKYPDVTEVEDSSAISEAYNYVTDPFLEWIGRAAYRFGTLLGYEEVQLQCALNGLSVILRYGHVFEDIGDIVSSNNESLQGFALLPRTVSRPNQLYRVTIVGDESGTAFELNKLSGALTMIQGEKRAVEWQLFYDHRKAGVLSHWRWRRVYQNLVMRERSGLALDQYPVMAASAYLVLVDLRRRLPPHLSRALPRETRQNTNSMARLADHMVDDLSEIHLKIINDSYVCPQDPESIRKFIERVEVYLSNLELAVSHAVRKENNQKL